MSLRISVVVPTLEEVGNIGPCVAAVRNLPGDWEVIVVDGGSRDGTAAAAREAGADQVLVSPPGRGTQLRAGAEAAGGEALLFLHADARLPVDAAEQVEATLAATHLSRGLTTTLDSRGVPTASSGGVAALRWSGGAFRLRHRAGNGGWLARRLLPLADLRSRFTRLPYGDQAVFTSRANYARAGGFTPQPLMEDVEFSRRLRKIGPIRKVPSVVNVSGRRFERAPWKSFLCWNLFPSLYSLGVSPERLARWYGTPREVSS